MTGINPVDVLAYIDEALEQTLKGKPEIGLRTRVSEKKLLIRRRTAHWGLLFLHSLSLRAVPFQSTAESLICFQTSCTG